MRAKLTELFHAESSEPAGGVDSLAQRGNETLTLDVKGGRMTFLTTTEESDDAAIRAGRFVTGEIELDNGYVFSFWLSDEGRGGLKEVAVYRSDTPQTG